MPIVEVDGIGRVTFPDEMSEADISSAINDHFKQVGVEQSINASMLPSRILTTPGVAEASAGARRFARIDRVRQLQEQRSPSEWTLEPETIAGIEQGVRPFQNPVKGAIQAGISGVAAAQRALGLPAYEPDRPILPPGVAKNAVEALAGAIPGESYGELGEGVRGASADLIGGFTPSDIAMFSPGGGIGYANEMSQAAPETAARFGQKLGEGNVPEATKAGAELAFTGLAPLSIMGHTGRSLMPNEPYVAPFTGRDLVKPRGSRMRVEPTEIAVNSPEAARVLGNQMQREATGVDFNPARRLPKAQVPEVGVEDPAQGIAEPEEKAVGLNLQAEIARRNNARSKADIQKLFPGMNRQQAAEVRNVAWGDPRTGALEAEPLENAPGEVPVEGVNQALAEDRNGEGTPPKVEEPPPVQSVPEVEPTPAPAVEAPAESVPAEAPSEPAQPELPQATPEPEKPPVAEPPTNLGDDFKSFLDQQAEEALKRITSRTQKSNTDSSMPLDFGIGEGLANFKDYTVYAAAKLAKHGVRGAEWTADMVKAFGEEIKPHLDALYQAALDHINAAKTEFKPAAAGPTTPVEILADAYSNKKGNTGIANTAGMAAKTIAHLDELKAKMLEERKRSKELGEKAKTAATTAEKIKLGTQALGVQFNSQYHLEAIETAADFMSNRESPVTKLGPRPLDWRKNPEVAEWIRTHSHELYPEENTYGLLPDELKAKAKTSIPEFDFEQSKGETLDDQTARWEDLNGGKSAIVRRKNKDGEWVFDRYLPDGSKMEGVAWDFDQAVTDIENHLGAEGPRPLSPSELEARGKEAKEKNANAADFKAGMKAAAKPPAPPKAPARNWELLTENLHDNLDSFSPARNTGRIDYEMQDVATRFTDFAKADKSGKDLTKLVSDFAKVDEATPSQLNKLRSALKSVLEKEAKPEAASEEPPAATTKEGGTIHDALNKAAQDALDRIDERTRRSNTGQSMRPDLGIGEGIANFKDYTIYGAAKLIKYGLDKAAWWADMLKTFGPKIKDLREDLFKAAQQHYADYKAEFSSKGKPTSVQEVINRAIGVERGPIDSTMSAMEALQTGLRTVRALRDHFKGQPKVSRDEVKAADDWLEGDANRIRQGLTDLVKRELPPEERGRFITAINNASRRSPILTGDPEAMYRRAAEVAARIEDRAQEVRKNDAISGIKAALTRALDSPGVDIGYKNRILDLFKRVGITKPTADTLNRLQATRDYLVRMAAEGKDVAIPKEILDHLEVLTKIPLRDLPLNAVQALADKIAHLEQLGRLKVKAREQVWEIEKQSHMATLPDERTTPLEERTQFAPQPGDPTTPSMKIRNWLIRLMNGASRFDKAYLPQDAVFDMLGDSKGGYRGWLFRHIRGPLDLAFNDYSVLRDAVTDPISKLVEKYKMGQREAERINTYARAMQEGGIERLIAQGVDPATIDKIIETFTPQERHVYSEMRKAMDGLLPQMQKLMHELYNIEVKPVENYWPLPRDWEAMRHLLKPADMKEPAFGEPMTFDDLAGWKDMFADFVAPKSTQAERGSTIERKPKAMTPVLNNAFDVFYQHINDVAYLLKTQRDLKMAGEMARTDEFAGKYGKLGQALVLDFLDTFARQGRLGGLRRIPWLDELRTRTAVGIIGFRIASNLVHASNVAFSIERAGIRNFSAAAMEIASGKADEFMRQNFAEAFSRGGGEPALVEAAAKGSSVFGQPLVSKNVARASMAAARAIDRFNAEATMLGVYFKELRAKGIDPATYKDMPIDKEAQAHAMVMARRAIASPLPKDVPSAISRGSLTGGNISLGKTVMQFQNIFADQWSNLRHDLWRAGIRGKDPVKVARMTLAIMGVVALETGIRETVKAGISSVTGKKQKEEDLQGAIIRETARRFPLGGQATAAILYDSSGVPMVDAFWDPAKEAYRSAKAKSPQKQNQHAIKAVTGAGQLMGLPVGQLGEVISDLIEK